MSDSQKFIRNILLFGGMWGVAEATLGYLLHFLPTGISGMIMFPIGFYFMYNAFKNSEKQSAVLFTAIVAASLKSVDLALPATPMVGVLNPAVSIILESLVVFAFIKVYQHNRHYQSAIFMSLAWILLFIIGQALVIKPVEGLYLLPAVEMSSYIFVYTIVSGLLIGSYLKFQTSKTLNPNISRFSFVQPGLIIVLALVCEIGNSLI